jgi:hypothetical protein
MAQISDSRHARIAEDAAAVIDRKINFLDWVRTLSEEELDDELIAELVDILAHEPKVGGLLGVSRETHAQHMADAHSIIAILRNGADTRPGFPLPSVDAGGKPIHVGAKVRINTVASWARGLPEKDHPRLRSYEGQSFQVLDIDRFGFVWFRAEDGGRKFCLMPNEVSVE